MGQSTPSLMEKPGEALRSVPVQNASCTCAVGGQGAQAGAVRICLSHGGCGGGSPEEVSCPGICEHPGHPKRSRHVADQHGHREGNPHTK